MKLSGFRSAACAAILAMAATATAQEGPKFEFHGFIGGSLYAQDAVFNGFGQQVFYVSKTPNLDRAIFGGDARQTRLIFSIAGPKVFGGAVPKGLVAMDFFGPVNFANSTTLTKDAAGNITAVTVNQSGGADYNFVPRIRHAYAELNWGATIFRFGQDDDLLLGGFGPATVGHIPQSYGYGSGVLGGRHQLVEVFQTVPAGDMKVELALQVTKPTSNAGALDPVTGQSFAEASGLPGFEGRARLIVPKLFEVFACGHWSRIDRNGVDDTVVLPAGFLSHQTVAVGNGGAKLTLGALTVQAQVFAGKNVGYSSNFNGVPGVTQGDLHEWGAWGQVGYNFTPQLSAWGYIGTEHPVYKEAAALGAKLQNTTTHGMLRYQEGGYALGLEYIHMITHYVANPANSTPRSTKGVLEGNQLMMSGMYFF